MSRIAFLVAIVVTAVLPRAAQLQAANKIWTAAVDGSYLDAARWTGGVPVSTDSATFDKAGSYVVTFPNLNATANDLFLSAGTVTFNRTGATASLSLTGAGGGQDLTIGGATLNLGQTLAVNVSVGDDVNINSGGALNLNVGSVLATPDLKINAGGTFALANGILNQQGNITVDGGAFLRTPGTTWLIPGSGGTFTAQNNAQVDLGDSVSLGGMSVNVVSGADMLATGGINFGSGGGLPTVIVDGVGSTLTAGGTSTWSGSVTPNLTVRNGATVSFGNWALGSTANSSSLLIQAAPSVTTSVNAANIEIASGTVSGSQTVTVGNGQGMSMLTQSGASTLLIRFNGVLNVNGRGAYTGGAGGVTINAGGVVNVLGGAFVSGGGITNNGTFNFNSGSVGYAGNLTVGTGGLLGDNLTLASDRQLTLSGTTTIDFSRSLTLNGGMLNTGALVVIGTFAFNSGTLGITGPGGLTIGSGGLLGSSLTLGAGRTLNVGQTTTINAGSLLTLDPGGNFSSGAVDNQGEFVVNGSATTVNATSFMNAGLLHGTGKLTAAVTNAPSGDVRVVAGERLRFAGASFTNQGLVEAIGNATSPAEIEFNSPVTNAASTGLIAGRNSALRFNAGLTNDGALAISIGTSDVFGDISNAATGRIVVSGGAGVTFYDDIVQNGTFQVSKVGSTTSVAVILGAFSGAGGSTGGGDIFFEGDLRPGNSPATVTFANNVGFGSGATLSIELGGEAPGSFYDQVHVTGALALGGALAVNLVDAGAGLFEPAAGDSFDILDWGSLSGSFASIQLPTLASFLQWDSSQLYTTGVLRVVSSYSADFDLDGDIDGDDFLRWQRGGSPNPLSASDLAAWRATFGTPPLRAASTAVPEPATFAMCAAGLAFAGAVRSRRPCRSRLRFLA